MGDSQLDIRQEARSWRDLRGAGSVLVPFLGIVLGLLIPCLAGSFPEHRSAFLGGLALAGGSWVWACRRAGALGSPSSPEKARAGAGEVSARWILLGALVLRLLVLSASLRTDPGLSDDVQRYLWEGALVAEGESPYAHAPSAPERSAERARWPRTFAAMNNQDVSAAYPPLAQLAFAAVVVASGGPPESSAQEQRWAPRAVLGMRALFTLADLGILALLLVGLKRRGASAGRAILWGWSPLIAIEFAGSAHFDSLGIVLLLGGLLLLERMRGGGAHPEGSAEEELPRGRECAGFALLAGGILVKLLPVFVVPFALRSSRRRWFACTALAVATLLFYVPVFLTSDGMAGTLSGVSAYASRWESFSLIFRWVDAPFAWLGTQLGAHGILAAPESRRLLTRALVGLLWLGLALRTLRRTCSALDAAFPLFSSFLLLTPTLHPWYLAWVIVFLPLRPSLPWTFLAAVAPLLYWPLTRWRAAGVWSEPAWLWPLVAVPFFLLLARELLLARHGSSARP